MDEKKPNSIDEIYNKLISWRIACGVLISGIAFQLLMSYTRRGPGEGGQIGWSGNRGDFEGMLEFIGGALIVFSFAVLPDAIIVLAGRENRQSQINVSFVVVGFFCYS